MSDMMTLMLVTSARKFYPGAHGWLAIFTLLLVLETAISLRILWTTDAALNKAAGASEKAANAAESADRLNMAGLRPWVEFANVSLKSDVILGDNEVSVIVNYTLKNTGRLPADRAAVVFSIKPYGFGARTIGGAETQRQECKIQSSWHGAIFPGVEQSGTFFIHMPRNVFDASIDHGSRIFLMLVVGCVRYSFPSILDKFFTGVAFLAAPKVNLVNPSGTGKIARGDFELTRVPEVISQ